MKDLNLKTKFIVGVGVLLGIVFLILISYIYQSEKAEHYKSELLKVENKIKLKALETKSVIENTSNLTESMAKTLSTLRENGNTDRVYANNVVKGVLLSNELIIGTSTAWEPNKWDGKDEDYKNYDKAHDETGRLIPWWYRSGNKIDVEKLVDYEKEGVGDWYLKPKQLKRSILSEPYLYPLDGKEVLMITISEPILEGGEFIGLTTSDLPINDLSKSLQEGLYKTGKISIFTEIGNVVANKEEELNGKNLKEIGKEYLYEIKKSDTEILNKEGIIYISTPIIFNGVKEKWYVIAEVKEGELYEGMFVVFLKKIGFASIGIVLILVALYIMIENLILKPLGGEPKDVMKFLKKIENGDLSMGKKTTNGENIISSIYNMEENLNEIIRGIKGTSVRIYDASNEIAIGNQNLSRRTENAASSLEETAASLEEATLNIKDNAKNTEEASKKIEKIKEDARIGANKVENVTIKITDIKRSGEEIGNFLQTIDSIAFQTNILALNAAVEAARAGESGRGFAVVASEVRNLSNKTTQTAKEIKQLLEKNNDNIKEGTLLAEEARKIINEIVSTIIESSDMIKNISEKIKEQSNGLIQINESVGNLDQGVQQNAALVEETKAATETLKNQIGKLNEIVNKFKI